VGGGFFFFFSPNKPNSELSISSKSMSGRSLSSNWNNPPNPLTGDGDVTLIILDVWLGDGTVVVVVLVDVLSSVVDGEIIVAADEDAVIILDV